ncbi:hypothetical protein Trydic_g9817 [Trypoxylus dichotomus]
MVLMESFAGKTMKEGKNANILTRTCCLPGVVRTASRDFEDSATKNTKVFVENTIRYPISEGNLNAAAAKNFANTNSIQNQQNGYTTTNLQSYSTISPNNLTSAFEANGNIREERIRKRAFEYDIDEREKKRKRKSDPDLRLSCVNSFANYSYFKPPTHNVPDIPSFSLYFFIYNKLWQKFISSFNNSSFRSIWLRKQ